MSCSIQSEKNNIVFVGQFFNLLGLKSNTIQIILHCVFIDYTLLIYLNSCNYMQIYAAIY